jgi:hypothetical protein
MVDEFAFARFWRVYPRRVGKLAAMKAFDRAMTRASLAEILAGVGQYTRLKPNYADWCHPSTWLNQGRWMDALDEPRQFLDHEAIYRECQTLHGGTCNGSRGHLLKMQIEAMKRAEAECGNG